MIGFVADAAWFLAVSLALLACHSGQTSEAEQAPTVGTETKPKPLVPSLPPNACPILDGPPVEGTADRSERADAVLDLLGCGSTESLPVVASDPGFVFNPQLEYELRPKVVRTRVVSKTSKIPDVWIVGVGSGGSTLRRALAPYLIEVQWCYQESLKRSPRLEGTLTVNLELGAEGTVDKAKVARTGFERRPSALAKCVAKAAKGWELDKRPSDGRSVQVSFGLRPQRDGKRRRSTFDDDDPLAGL